MSQARRPSIDNKVRVTQKKTISKVVARGDKPTKVTNKVSAGNTSTKNILEVHLLTLHIQDIDDSSNDYSLNLGVFGNRKAAERELANWAFSRWVEGGGGLAPWSPSWDDENYPLASKTFEKEAKKYRKSHTDKQFIEAYFEGDEYASYNIEKKNIRW